MSSKYVLHTGEKVIRTLWCITSDYKQPDDDTRSATMLYIYSQRMLYIYSPGLDFYRELLGVEDRCGNTSGEGVT